MKKNHTETNVTTSEYNTLVSFQDQLIDFVREDEKHHLEPLLNKVGNYIKSYEDAYVGDVSIGLETLTTDLDMLYDAVLDDKWTDDVVDLWGIITVSDENCEVYKHRYEFNGYIDYAQDKVTFSDIMRGNICSVAFTDFIKWREKEYGYKFFTQFMEWVFRTGNYYISDKFNKDYDKEVKEFIDSRKDA